MKKKLTVLVAMLALVIVTGAPVMAQLPPQAQFCPPGAIGNPNNPHFPFCPGAGGAGVGVGAGEAVPVASQEFSESRITSGAASPSFSFSNTGDNVNACPTEQQVVNTGNVANEQGVVQYLSTADDIDFSGSEINIAPAVSGSCTQGIEQAASTG